MHENAAVTALVSEQYGITPAAIQCISRHSPDHAVYQVEAADARTWLVRLHRIDQPVPRWVMGPDMLAWLTRQATVLHWCGEQNIPAPALCPTQHGAQLASKAGWCALMTTFVAGSKVRTVPDQLNLLAAALGRLHRLGASDNQLWPASLPDSWWHPLAAASRRALAQLAGLQDVPAQWQTLLADCHTVLETMHQYSALPTSVIHGDCWVGNAIYTTDRQVTLIDWEYAGRGLALLDFAALLGDCFANPATQLQPDLACVEAVVVGYRQERGLSATELAALPVAMRFGAAFRGALRFGMTERMGWSNGIQRGLAHEQARFAVSEQIAQLALRFFAELP